MEDKIKKTSEEYTENEKYGYISYFMSNTIKNIISGEIRHKNLTRLNNKFSFDFTLFSNNRPYEIFCIQGMTKENPKINELVENYKCAIPIIFKLRDMREQVKNERKRMRENEIIRHQMLKRIYIPKHLKKYTSEKIKFLIKEHDNIDKIIVEKVFSFVYKDYRGIERKLCRLKKKLPLDLEKSQKKKQSLDRKISIAENMINK